MYIFIKFKQLVSYIDIITEDTIEIEIVIDIVGAMMYFFLRDC